MSKKSLKFYIHFPRSRIDEYESAKAKADAALRKEFYEQFASVANKYMPLQRDKNGIYLVFIAKARQNWLMRV